MQTDSKRRAKAPLASDAAARKFQNPHMAQLATAVRLDAFVKVKKAIDDMVAALLQEKADEIKHKDFCTAEFNQNEKDTEKNERKKAGIASVLKTRN